MKILSFFAPSEPCETLLFINFAIVRSDNAISPNREILRLALPAIASNITVPLLGLCDTAVTGHLGDEVFLAAVAAGGTIFNVILWLCGFLRMGTTGLTAEAFGARRNHDINVIFWRAATLASALGLLVILFQRPLLSLFMSIIAPATDVAVAASRYFSICVWGIPPLLITLSINGWFIGMQDTVRPMIISISMNLLNVAASLIAVYALHAGFDGVAYGTLTANWAGLLISATIVALYSKKTNLRPRLLEIVGSGGFARFFRVSSDLFLRSACIMGVSLSVTAIGARMGDTIMAANAIMLQFFLLFSYFTDGFSFAGEALVGKYSGANNMDAVKSSARRLLIWSAAIATSFMLIYLFGLKPFTAMLTDVAEVRECVIDMGVYVWILPPIAVWAFIYDGFFIGLTATRRMFLTTLAAIAIFGAIIVIGTLDINFATSTAAGNRILWSAFLSFLAIRGLGLALQFPRLVRKQLQ